MDNRAHSACAFVGSYSRVAAFSCGCVLVCFWGWLSIRAASYSYAAAYGQQGSFRVSYRWIEFQGGRFLMRERPGQPLLMERCYENESPQCQGAKGCESHLVAPGTFLRDSHYDGKVKAANAARRADDAGHHTGLPAPAVRHELEGRSVPQAKAEVQEAQESCASREGRHQDGKAEVADGDGEQQHQQYIDAGEAVGNPTADRPNHRAGK